MTRIVSVALLLALVSSARADDRAKAQEAYHAASQHYDLGEYREALEGFKEAYRNHEDPTFLFNIAQCNRQLGDKANAIRAYRSFLNKMPGARNRVQVREMIAKLETQLASEQAAKSGPPQGTLSPNAPSSAAPTSEPDHPPPVLLATSAPASPPPATATSEPANPPPATVATEPAPVAKSEPIVASSSPAAPAKPIYKRWWLWTAVGVGAAVALGVGLGVGLTPSSSGAPSESTNFGTFRF
jgi:tetratricopeptide (TPR) repeat protein